jgi:hypothetical protein
MVNSGSGYTNATVTITGDGSNATARAILPPIGGHGKNAITELYGVSIMTYTKISNSDTYNNFGFNNQFYQYGIIANPTQYNSTKIANSNIVSPCVSVTGVFSLANFPLNATVRIVVNTKNEDFLVVDSTSTTLLLQQLSNYLPMVGQNITNIGNSISFTITDVGLPSMDKENGSIIDINNATTSFYKTSSQVIALRTIISL